MNVLLVASGAYMAWEHEQGRHGQPNLLCPICWLNKIAPGPAKPSASGTAEPPDQT